MTKTPEFSRDWMWVVVKVGDHVVHFKGGAHDRIDHGVVTKITAGGNYRLTILRSSRESEVTVRDDAYADKDRVIRVPPMTLIALKGGA
jgi:hypothetical protein